MHCNQTNTSVSLLLMGVYIYFNVGKLVTLDVVRLTWVPIRNAIKVQKYKYKKQTDKKKTK